MLFCVAGAMFAALPAGTQPLAIVHARAWTLTAPGPVEDATIAIEGGKIVAVMPGGAPPAGALVIDAHGEPVTPGLIDAASQLGLIEVSTAAATRDLASTAHGLGAGFDVRAALNGNSALVALARADGLTGALSYPDKSKTAPFAGEAALVRLREGSDILDRPAAALVAVIGGDQWSKGAGSRAAQWQLLRAAFDKARASKARAVPGTDEAAIAATAKGETPLALFADRETDMREAARFATDYRVRLVVVGGAEAWRAADVLAAAHVAVVLDPQANQPVSFDALGNRLDAAAILTHAGVTVAFGVAGGAIELSFNAGINLREGAGLAVANGLPYLDALKAMTVNPHRLWGGGSGTLAAGERADLVVWDGDPLEVSTNAVAVIVEGRPVPTDNRQRALEERYLPPVAQK
jgi:imidazolonepropionase-like amidohydrolase